jgi:molybdopterin adenylyltransferase
MRSIVNLFLFPIDRNVTATLQQIGKSERFILLSINSMLPHSDRAKITVNCAVITVSDSRTTETDRSGQLIQELLKEAEHQIVNYQIIPDEPNLIRSTIADICNRNHPIDAFIFNGGTGIALRDNTYEAIAGLLEKTLPGFGEIFRFLSYQEIGSRAIASRAIAGVYRQKLIFSLPGSSNGVKLAMERLILPELIHLTKISGGISS